jgi:hypothetical protein
MGVPVRDLKIFKGGAAWLKEQRDSEDFCIL